MRNSKEQIRQAMLNELSNVKWDVLTEALEESTCISTYSEDNTIEMNASINPMALKMVVREVIEQIFDDAVNNQL